MSYCCNPAGRSRLVRLAEMGWEYVDWYDAARAEMAQVCRREDWSIDRFAHALALTSARVKVKRNVKLALAYCRGQQFACLPNTRRTLAYWETYGVVSPRAHKLAAFAAALLGDTESVVLDVWMARALRVDHKTLGGRPNVQRACVARVCSAARYLGMTPRDCQAAIWSGALADDGRNPMYYPILETYLELN